MYLLQDIGYCKQYGCSILIMVKNSKISYESICFFCAGLNNADRIYDILSQGYKSVCHPKFDSAGLLVTMNGSY